MKINRKKLIMKNYREIFIEFFLELPGLSGMGTGFFLILIN
jgi:hypothetical protein